MFPSRVTIFGRVAVLGVLALAISGCSWIDRLGLGGGDEPPPSQFQAQRANTSGLAGMSGAVNPAAGSAVNAFLWRAALDTVAFMPVTQADPYGGVIITDWFSPPGAGNERFKVNLFIVDAALRADGVRASVFRQVLDQTGSWRDAPVAQETQVQLEDTILTRARQLRIQSTPPN